MLAGILQQTHGQLVPARQDYSLQFNNQFLLAPVNDQLKLGDAFTMSCWVNPSARVPYAIIMGKPAPNRGQDPYMSYTIGWSQSGARLEFVLTTGAAGSYRAVTAPTDAPLNAWTHVAATLQNGTMRLFINGQELGSSASAGNPPVNQVPFAIGGGLDGGNYCCGMMGNLMQASVWSKALTASEISALAQTTPAASAAGLISFWKMAEGSGQTVADLSTNNITLQLGTSALADPQDPTWTSNFIFNQGPFFTLHQNQLAIPYGLNEIFPYQKSAAQGPAFVGISIQWPPSPPPGASRPIEYLAVENNQVKVKTTEMLPGAPQIVHARHSAQGDFNRDGLNDFILIGHGTDVLPFPGEQSRIFMQQPDGTLRDETATRLPAANDFTHHVTVGDIDKDGDLDIYFANIGGGTNGPRFLINNGVGVFTVQTNTLPAEVVNRSKVFTSSILVDFDKDQDLDLYLGADERAGENLILFNNGQGKFEITAKSRLNKLPDNTWIGVGVAVADFDNDGDLDLISNNTRGNPFYQGAFLQLLLNDGTGGFTDHSTLLPAVYSQNTTSQEWVVWVDTVDINKDGWMDLITKGNNVPSKLFLNHGGSFQDMTHLLPAGFAAGAGFRAGDFDLDGDTDLVAINGMTGYVLENVKPFKNSIARITANGKTSYCAGATVSTALSTFSVPGYTFQWLKNDQPISGANNATYTATEPGVYKVISKNGEYPAATSVPVTIQLSSGGPATITQNGNKLMASEGLSFKWYLNGQELAFTTREITPAASGNYMVEVSQASGCAISGSFAFSLVSGVEEFASGQLRLYPNPTANGEVFLSYGEKANFRNAVVQVLNLQGQVLQEGTIKQKTSKIVLPKAAGMYLVKVTLGDRAFVTRVVKN
ncbi:hypothetical protein TH63_05650 [Rufibacter radiotolerans]|uniref:LamG-like jellyroll fold domain-containing protein n=1 Tax=Rufibacter radiotolerans TaxID=1379910 RepID=A0A0H4W493_9BACT|nr:hypothetical protein TH63_05650 [Rufibacter radiotolerans]